jgi:hypothetical protein
VQSLFDHQRPTGDRDLAGALRDNAGGMPPLPGAFPDYPAPIVRNAPDGSPDDEPRLNSPVVEPDN